MWKSIARYILHNRIVNVSILLLITIFLGWHATKVELSYEFVRPLPSTDSALINYDKFREMFGEDGTVMLMGFTDKDFYQLDKFNDWYTLTQEMKKVDGIKDVMSVTNIFDLERDDSLMKFHFKPIIQQKLNSQTELDSVKKKIDNLVFYQGLVHNPKTNSTLMLITFDKNKLNSVSRLQIVADIREKSEVFAQKYKLEMHYSGMPFVRATMMKKVSGELRLFLILAVLVTIIILYFIFKSFRIVAYSMVLVAIGIIWSLGSLHLMGYQITILTGLIPSIITVIGLPNCVFIINKYQTELVAHGNKELALENCISKVALSNFLANVTTAIGFAVFYFTNSSLLESFGIVAAINVITTFVAAHIIIPIILSITPSPKPRHIRHLTGKRINALLEWVVYLIQNKRMAIYSGLTIITIISIGGWYYIKLLGYIVDDLPQRDPLYVDLKYFETNYHGVMPFEISIDTKKKNGVFGHEAEALKRIKAFEKYMQQYNEFSKPISLVEAVKFAYQAYNNGEKRFYNFPPDMELNNLASYTKSMQGKESRFAGFLDSTKRFTRISYQMADVGSEHMKQLVKTIQPKLDSIFPKDKYTANITGNSLVFLKGNDYLFHHLFISLAIAIVLILLLGMVLFRSVAIIVLSKLPCLIPLIITAGIMGYFGIRFKPSTILIFSIAFGITSDGTIYILTEYWNQLRNKANADGLQLAVSNTVREVGVSMLYTAIILFCGFAIFAASSFGGTQALGVLMSLTIAVSLATNLVFLPSILISLENIRNKKKKRNNQ